MTMTIDRNLLQLLQRQVPLTPEPFAHIAREMGCDEQSVLDAISRLRREGVIREISGIFDVAALGYRQALVTMKVDGPRLDEAGAIASNHPGVSHCYSRSGAYNLWLTLAASPRSKLGLEESAKRLAKMCGASSHLLLPTVKRYKLQVEFNAGEESAEDSTRTGPIASSTQGETRAHEKASPSASLSQDQVSAIRALQIDLPARRDPFATLAQQAGMTVDQLLALGNEMLVNGMMRRYAAVLHHRSAGAQANVLVAWNVPPAQADSAGRRCAEFPAVSHCYLRPSAQDWPYSLYTMIHGRSREDCEMTIAEIVATAELSERAELWTIAEYKKARVPLFTDDEQAWEQR